jgi:hypothetical protein
MALVCQKCGYQITGFDVVVGYVDATGYAHGWGFPIMSGGDFLTIIRLFFQKSIK